MSTSVDRAPRERGRGWQMLDNAIAWEGLRLALDAGFGLYRRRVAMLHSWGVLDGAPSVVDVGCGIGQYAAVTAGPYLGVDMTERYIEHARRRNRSHPQREFRTADVAALEAESRTFDIVLMVDILHHLDDGQCHALLATAANLSGRYVASFEPVLEQHNPVGRWIVGHDRGDHMRSSAAARALFDSSPLTVERSEELRLGPVNTRAILASATPS